MTQIPEPAKGQELILSLLEYILSFNYGKVVYLLKLHRDFFPQR